MPWSPHAPTSSLMSSMRVGELSVGSSNQSRPVRSHTYIRPLFSKVMPTASPHGPEIAVSVNPGGTVDAETLFAVARLTLAKKKQAIAMLRQSRAEQIKGGGILPDILMNALRVRISSRPGSVAV